MNLTEAQKDIVIQEYVKKYGYINSYSIWVSNKGNVMVRDYVEGHCWENDTQVREVNMGSVENFKIKGEQPMNRTIKFRGKRIDTGEWVYGCLINNMWTYSELSKFPKGTSVCQIITGIYESDDDEAYSEESNNITVHPESVGQFTNLLDKHGKEIYDKSPVLLNDGNKGKIEWSAMASQWWIVFEDVVPYRKSYRELIPDYGDGQNYCLYVEIIENPELLGKEEAK